MSRGEELLAGVSKRWDAFQLCGLHLRNSELRSAYEAQGPPTLHFLCPSVICIMNLGP
jgi:hypothetical protein